MSLHKRLLRDLAEIKSSPYPNIEYIPRNDNVREGCLVLIPEPHRPLHFIVSFPDEYPLQPPVVDLLTTGDQPTRLGSLGGMTMLSGGADWTPAYTLKSVAIQLLTCFSPELDERIRRLFAFLLGPRVAGIDITDSPQPSANATPKEIQHHCSFCGFGGSSDPGPVRVRPHVPADRNPLSEEGASTASNVAGGSHISELPNEVLVRLCSYLEDEDVMNFGHAWTRIGGAKGLLRQFNILQDRQLECFVLKTSFKEAKLGIGMRQVHRPSLHPSLPLTEFEFDLISQEAFDEFRVRRSANGVRFTHWLPLALSRPHYDKVKIHYEDPQSFDGDFTGPPVSNLSDSQFRLSLRHGPDNMYDFIISMIATICSARRFPDHGPEAWKSMASGMTYEEASPIPVPPESQSSVLYHPSERALEMFFHLFHIWLCMATADHKIRARANEKLQLFDSNHDFLLLARLVSDIELTTADLHSVLDAAITGQVAKLVSVFPDLAYLEPEDVCERRLKKTFDAGWLRYRMLMLSQVLHNIVTANWGEGVLRKSLHTIRDELFAARGAPPIGAADMFRAQVKHMFEVDNMLGFLRFMGIPESEVGGEAACTRLLRACVRKSMLHGLSQWPCDQMTAKQIRIAGGGVDLTHSKSMEVERAFPGRN